MNFNSDTSKQAKEVLFSRKGYYSIIQYMKPQLKSGSFSICSRLIKLLDYYDIYKTLPRPSLLTIYKSVIGPHLDYGDIIYDQACVFSKK